MKRIIINTIAILIVASAGCKRDYITPLMNPAMNKSIDGRRSIEDSLIYLMRRDTLTGLDTVWLYGEPYMIIANTN